MKKFLSLIIVLCLLLSFNLACNKKKKTNNSQLNTSANVTTQSSVFVNNTSQSSASVIPTISGISKNEVTTQTQTTINNLTSQERTSISSNIIESTSANSSSTKVSSSISINKIYSYVVEPSFCGEYITVQMFVNEVEVFEAPIGEVVKFVITSADRVHYSIGYVSINGQVKFDVLDTSNYPNGEYKGKVEFEVPVTSGGFEIYIKIIWQNTTS